MFPDEFRKWMRVETHIDQSVRQFAKVERTSQFSLHYHVHYSHTKRSAKFSQSLSRRSSPEMVNALGPLLNNVIKSCRTLFFSVFWNTISATYSSERIRFTSKYSTTGSTGVSATSVTKCLISVFLSRACGESWYQNLYWTFYKYAEYLIGLSDVFVLSMSEFGCRWPNMIKTDPVWFMIKVPLRVQWGCDSLSTEECTTWLNTVIFYPELLTFSAFHW